MRIGMPLWVFADDGQDQILVWANRIGLPTSVRAKLDLKLDMLRQQPFDLLIHTKMLAGPLDKQHHIYKLRVNGQVAVRLMLCRGPLADEAGYTLLLGAAERDGRYEPRHAPELAEQRRQEVLLHPERKRKKYERLGQTSAAAAR